MTNKNYSYIDHIEIDLNEYSLDYMLDFEETTAAVFMKELYDKIKSDKDEDDEENGGGNGDFSLYYLIKIILMLRAKGIEIEGLINLLKEKKLIKDKDGCFQDKITNLLRVLDVYGASIEGYNKWYKKIVNKMIDSFYSNIKKSNIDFNKAKKVKKIKANGGNIIDYIVGTKLFIEKSKLKKNNLKKEKKMVEKVVEENIENKKVIKNKKDKILSDNLKNEFYDDKLETKIQKNKKVNTVNNKKEQYAAENKKQVQNFEIDDNKITNNKQLNNNNNKQFGNINYQQNIPMDGQLNIFGNIIGEALLNTMKIMSGMGGKIGNNMINNYLQNGKNNDIKFSNHNFINNLLNHEMTHNKKQSTNSHILGDAIKGIIELANDGKAISSILHK